MVGFKTNYIVEYHKVIAFHNQHDILKYGSEIIVDISAHRKEVVEYLLMQALNECADNIAKQDCAQTQGQNYPDLQLHFNCFFFKDAQYQYSDCIANIRRADRVAPTLFFKDIDEVSFVANFLYKRQRNTYIGKQNESEEFQYYTGFFKKLVTCGISKLSKENPPLHLEWLEASTPEDLYLKLKQWHDDSKL